MQLSIGVGCVLYATALTLKDSRAGFLAKHSDRMHVCNHLLAHLHPSAISRLPVVSEKTMIHRKSGGLGSFAALDRGEVCTKLMCSCLREIGRKRAPSRKALLKDVIKSDVRQGKSKIFRRKFREAWWTKSFKPAQGHVTVASRNSEQE